MNLNDIVNIFEAQVAADNNINTFLFDELSTINIDRQKKYPLLLLKIPSRRLTNFPITTGEPVQIIYNFTFYLLDTWNNEDKKTKKLPLVLSNLALTADRFLRTLAISGSNNFQLFDRNIDSDFGHHKYVDQLIGVTMNFKLIVNDCL